MINSINMLLMRRLDFLHVGLLEDALNPVGTATQQSPSHFYHQLACPLILGSPVSAALSLRLKGTVNPTR